ncbi:hypothetical protein AAE478_008377 [Parahypoxylon ruwenzoriense]
MTTKKRVPLPAYPRKQGAKIPTDSSPTIGEKAKSEPAKRKKGRTKAITSCERCRRSHINFTRLSNGTAASSVDGIKEISPSSAQGQKLQALAASALAYVEAHMLEERDKRYHGS